MMSSSSIARSPFAEARSSFMRSPTPAYAVCFVSTDPQPLQHRLMNSAVCNVGRLQ